MSARVHPRREPCGAGAYLDIFHVPVVILHVHSFTAVTLRTLLGAAQPCKAPLVRATVTTFISVSCLGPTSANNHSPEQEPQRRRLEN